MADKLRGGSTAGGFLIYTTDNLDLNNIDGDLTVTGDVTAPNFIGNLTGNVTGNANTASRWASTIALTTTLTGDVTGNATVNIDGSSAQNLSITATVANNSHTHTEANITDLDKYTQAQVDSALALKVNTSELAVANGVATLDGSAKLTASQIPDSLLGGLTYQGTWNASTNTPTLTSSVGTQGHYYRVNVAGNTDLDGITEWEVSDWAVFNGTVWERVDNTNEVTSVAGKTGDVILVEADITNLDKYSRSYIDTELAKKLNTTAKAADSDKLDNLDSTQFLRSDATDSASGIISFTASSIRPVIIGNNTNTATGIEFSTQSAQKGYFEATHLDTESLGGTYSFHLGSTETITNVIIDGVGDFFSGTNKVHHDGYHPNADKWTTARTITLTGGVTGSVSIDGSANVSLSTAVDGSGHDHDGIYLPVGGKAADSNLLDGINSTQFIRSDADDAVTGLINFDTNTGAKPLRISRLGSNSAEMMDVYVADTAAYFDYYEDEDIYPQIFFRGNGTGTSAAQKDYLRLTGSSGFINSQRLFADDYHPNADRWTASRTITLNGDVSGSVSINGSTNVTLTATVANDSHNHTTLTGVTSLDFNTGASDSASISTTVNGTSTFFDFNLADDNNNDWWRWRFTPSGSTVYDAMILKPVSNGNADLTVSGKIIADSFTGSVIGNADTATWADTVDVNSENTSSSWYDVVWHSGDSLYSTQSSKAVEIQSSTGTIRAPILHSSTGKVDLTTAASVEYNSNTDSIDFLFN